MPDKWRTHWLVPGSHHVPEGEFDQDCSARHLERDQAVNRLAAIDLEGDGLRLRLVEPSTTRGLLANNLAVVADAAIELPLGLRP